MVYSVTPVYGIVCSSDDWISYRFDVYCGGSQLEDHQLLIIIIIIYNVRDRVRKSMCALSHFSPDPTRPCWALMDSNYIIICL